jgi:tetratricopeptide (TPR) repeat protein
VLYAEGLIRQNCLGQGHASYQLFERAYHAARRGNGLKTTKWFAACNASLLAPDEAAYQRWGQAADRSRPLLKRAEFIEALKALTAGAHFDDLQLQGVAQAFERGDFGLSAAVAEVVLTRIECADRMRVELLKSRAFALRRLDQADEQRRTFAGEAMPAADRLALRDAAVTMQRALEIDAYDVEGWNFLSAWRNLLGDFQEACEAADRAIDLRPVHYPKPRTNKAAALAKLTRRAEACEEARAGLAIAQANHGSGYESESDIRICQALIANTCGPEPSPPTDDEIVGLINKILHGAEMSATAYVAKAKTSIPELAEAVKKRCSALRSDLTGAYTAIVADLLMFFSAEVAWFTINIYTSFVPGDAARIREASAIIIAEGSAAQCRDAARLLTLLLITGNNLARTRAGFRVDVMVRSQAEGSPFKKLESVVRLELDRFSPELTARIADQSSLTPEEMRAARDGILRRMG